jgi:hypothetical protein
LIKKFRARSDKRGIELISNALPFGRSDTPDKNF